MSLCSREQRPEQLPWHLAPTCVDRGQHTIRPSGDVCPTFLSAALLGSEVTSGVVFDRTPEGTPGLANADPTRGRGRDTSARTGPMARSEGDQFPSWALTTCRNVEGHDG